jgi:segregation and condensation protein B
MDEQAFHNLCEALLFASPQPVDLETLHHAVETREIENFQEAFDRFVQAFNTEPGGMQILQIAGGYQMVTRSQFAPYIQRLKTIQKKTRLSRAACETLAIIAYQQPVTQPEIEHIRGVDSGGVVKNLLDKQLITILGKKHAPGNPILYGTTNKFLSEFGLKELTALPNLKEFEQLLTDESPGVTVINDEETENETDE